MVINIAKARYGFSFLGENLLNAGDAEFLELAPRTFSGGLEDEY